ncbi:MAG TPA: hypothetical protein VD927_11645 [Chryseosolibacter sp.]|nr:hypothetical protein [Chryseosolibacter sp.]
MIADKCWLEIPKHFPRVVLHEHIVMPNHIHGIIELVGANKYSHDNVNHHSPDATNNHSPHSTNDHSPQTANHEIREMIANDFPHSDAPNRNDDIPTNGNATGINGMENNGAENDCMVNNGAKNVCMENNGAKINGMENNGAKINGTENNGAKVISPLRSPSGTIGSIVRGYKIGVTKWMRENTPVHDVWQRNYYDRIIQSQQSYETISLYIMNNPAKWASDKFYSQ